MDSIMAMEHPDSYCFPVALQAYLLGTIDFEAALLFQRRLHYEISGDRTQAALILCEHPPLITVGRHGSRAHILCEPDELRARGWRVRWVNRGGGCLLHVPGQLAIYPVFPLDTLGLDPVQYLWRLANVVQAVLREFHVRGQVSLRPDGVAVNARLLASLGVAVRDWVSYYGAYVNIQPRLDWCRMVRSDRLGGLPMTSLERERRAPVRPALVRNLFLEHFQARFAFSRLSLFSDHPSLSGYLERCREKVYA